jgi:hypothetical protein
MYEERSTYIVSSTENGVTGVTGVTMQIRELLRGVSLGVSVGERLGKAVEGGGGEASNVV